MFIITRKCPGGVYLDAPDAHSIYLEDIAHALGCIPRFVGHTPQPYSVAEHSCLVADIVRKNGGSDTAIALALLHDAAEAYIGDIPSPLKNMIPAVKPIEEGIMEAIRVRFGLVRSRAWDRELIKRADRHALHMERESFFPNSTGSGWPDEPSDGKSGRIDWLPACLTPGMAEVAFTGYARSIGLTEIRG